jgi:hypothetical protein
MMFCSSQIDNITSIQRLSRSYNCLIKTVEDSYLRGRLTGINLTDLEDQYIFIGFMKQFSSGLSR